MNKLNKFLLIIITAFAPAVTLAQEKKTLATLIDTIVGYFDSFLLLLMGFAIVMFTWYVIQYFIKPNAERKEASMYVLYSVIGFFVLLSFWGLVNVLQNTFGLGNETYKPSSWTSFSNLFPSGSTVNNGNKNAFQADDNGLINWEANTDTDPNQTDGLDLNSDQSIQPASNPNQGQDNSDILNDGIFNAADDFN